MLSKRLVFVFILLMLVVGAVSTVNATDISDDAIGDVNDDKIEIIDDEVSDDENSLEIAESDSVMSNSNEDVLTANPGTFSELQDYIYSGGSTITLSKDYSYNEGSDGNTPIYLDKSMTLNGNGHTIDGMGKSKIFTIGSEIGTITVTLKNLIIKNG